MKKRTIFDTAYWMDLQHRRQQEKNQAYRTHIERLRKPIQPEQTVSMEIEETGNAAQIELQKEKIVEVVEQAKQDIAEAIKIELQPPKGYILFPEPEQAELDDYGITPTYTVEKEETENSES